MYMNNVRTFWVNAFRNLGYLNPPGLYMMGVVNSGTLVIKNCACKCGCLQIDDSTDNTRICTLCSLFCPQPEAAYVCSCCVNKREK